MTDHSYRRAPAEDPSSSKAAKNRFTSGTRFEPGHDKVVLAHHAVDHAGDRGSWTTECVYSRLEHTFSSLPGSYPVTSVMSWSDGDVVLKRQQVTTLEEWDRYLVIHPGRSGTQPKRKSVYEDLEITPEWLDACWEAGGGAPGMRCRP